jgi:hypothetical protein
MKEGEISPFVNFSVKDSKTEAVKING